jgi:MFS family permease
MPFHLFSPDPPRLPLLERGRHRLRLTFSAMRHRDYTLFWFGQWISVTGTWMQTMAQSWLIYRLTDSAFILGVLATVRFGPSLVGSPLAGVVADRFPRRNLVLITQSISLLIASALASLTLTGAVRVWHILALALVQGIVDTLDMTARQTLQVDLVGMDDLQSAVALNSAAFNTGRMVGPALAGVLVALYGEGVCFAINAASYVAVLAALLGVRASAVIPRSGRSVGRDLLDGLRYAWSQPSIRAVLLAVAVTSLAGLSYSTLLPVLARDILKSGAQGYGLLLSGVGLGAITGALGAAARRGNQGAGGLIGLGQAVLGAGLVALGLSRVLWISCAWMVLVGLAVTVQLAVANALLQTTAPPALRGRVISLYIWLFAGLSPIGGLAAGWAAEHVGAPLTAVGGGIVCLASAVWTRWAWRGSAAAHLSDPAAAAPPAAP